MKVLHFYKTYYPDSFGGVEQVIFQLATGSSQFGIESTVLSLSPNKIDRLQKFEGHQGFRCRSHFKLASTDFSLSIFRYFKKLAQKADIVHYHFPWPFMDLVHFVTNHKKPTILTYHSDIVRQKNLLKIYKPLMYKFLNSVDSIVATSPNYLHASDILQKYRYKVDVIPIGLDKKLYTSIKSNKHSYWLDKLGNKFFLFVGVLRYYKGLHILLDALALHDFPTVIVGAGPVEVELKAKAISLGLKNIKFLGQVSDEDKIAILELSYAVVFPSHLRSEAFGISLLEGAMFGKPMISSEIGTGTSYINIHNETGIIVNPSSPTEFSAAMKYLWDNPQIAMQFGFNAALRFTKHFTADKMCQSYSNIYQRLIEAKAESKS